MKSNMIAHQPDRERWRAVEEKTETVCCFKRLCQYLLFARHEQLLKRKVLCGQFFSLFFCSFYSANGFILKFIGKTFGYAFFRIFQFF